MEFWAGMFYSEAGSSTPPAWSASISPAIERRPCPCRIPAAVSLLHVERLESPIPRTPVGSRVLIPHWLNLLLISCKQTTIYPFSTVPANKPTHEEFPSKVSSRFGEYHNVSHNWRFFLGTWSHLSPGSLSILLTLLPSFSALSPCPLPQGGAQPALLSKLRLLAFWPHFPPKECS